MFELLGHSPLRRGFFSRVVFQILNNRLYFPAVLNAVPPKNTIGYFLFFIRRQINGQGVAITQYLQVILLFRLGIVTYRKIHIKAPIFFFENGSFLILFDL